MKKILLISLIIIFIVAVIVFVAFLIKDLSDKIKSRDQELQRYIDEFGTLE